jgi:hypothetical protein
MLPSLILLAAAALAAPLDDLAWMAGTWRGGGDGQHMEEHWSEPAGASMVGSFHLVVDGQPVFYELMVIEIEGDTPVMRLKHFDPGLVGWEKRKQCLSFTLTEQQVGSWARFEEAATGKQLVYTRRGDSLTIELSHEDGLERFELALQRPDVPPTPALEGPSTGIIPEPTGD